MQGEIGDYIGGLIEPYPFCEGVRRVYQESIDKAHAELQKYRQRLQELDFADVNEQAQNIIRGEDNP